MYRCMVYVSDCGRNNPLSHTWLSPFVQLYLPHSTGCRLTATSWQPHPIKFHLCCYYSYPLRPAALQFHHFAYRFVRSTLQLFCSPVGCCSVLRHAACCIQLAAFITFSTHSSYMHTEIHTYTEYIIFSTPIFAPQFFHSPVKWFARALTKPQYHINSVILRFRLNVTWQRCGASQHGFYGHSGYCK